MSANRGSNGDAGKSPRTTKNIGCEMEARGINYMISTPATSHRFKIWNREDEQKQKEYEEDVEQQLAMKERPKTRHVLKNISCIAKPYEILAIVGPSGAGKSTLLEILAGKLSPANSPAVFVDGIPMDRSRFRKISGYVTQKDTLFPLLTVEETLMFSAQLRLGSNLSHLSNNLQNLLQELGLKHVANTRIGDEKIRGISGGERRRVSIGVEAIHNPKVLILDEPTSGLDSMSAFSILDMLKRMAENHGRTIILSIHQPGFRIIKLFNSILLLANGSVLHHGTVDQLQAQLMSTGLQLPLHVNVLEYAMDAIETLQSQKKKGLEFEYSYEKDKEVGDQKDNRTLQELFESTKVIEKIVDYVNSPLREIAILTHRFTKNVIRNNELVLMRIAQMLASGLVLGSVFHSLKVDRVGAEERVGLFAFILTFLLSCTTEGLPIFLQEREILLKETSCGSYRISSYVIANGLVFLPFVLVQAVLFAPPLYWLVGLNKSFTSFMYFVLLIWLILYMANSVVVFISALAPNFIVGNSMIQGLMGSFFLFSGFFISKNGIPSYWKFMNYISIFKYPFEGLLWNEFSGSEKCLFYKYGMCVITAKDVLEEEGMDEEGRWSNVGIMVCFILTYRFLSYFFLKCRCSQRNLRSVIA